MVSAGDAIVEAVGWGKAYRDEIIEHCLAKGLPKSTIYRRLGSEVKKWSTLAMVRVEREDREVAYLRWREELDEAFSKPSSAAFTFKLLETENEHGKSFLVEVTAKGYSENCRVKARIIPCSLRAQGGQEFEVYWYPQNRLAFDLNPGEPVKAQLVRLALPEDKLKHIEHLERAYSSAPDLDDVKSHIDRRLREAYESLERSIAKCFIDSPEYPSGFELASKVNVLILLVYSKSHFGWSPFLFIKEALEDTKPYKIIEYVSKKATWRRSELTVCS